ncbi:asparaginyl-tRNA synthetase [Hymenobacter luteus]|uniref:Asparagine--tRNA ligase n=2 Tax=Hymenobacter TaxID=89966 RepID=A0A7W9T206_9BACT|nr:MULTISPECIES: asparagine--tRNA ligase [Hymenobacter]MBB4603239.1 asparaginyl-tRNA synthetase [Hymenobacter latericoloratus]MBB6060137.1 asparaginyl-tRNA synthetase [Hymenobacter luteus]
MSDLRKTSVQDLLRSTELDREVLVKGWVRTRRGNKYVQFIAVNDGSGFNSIQVVANAEQFPEEKLKADGVENGAAVQVRGRLVASQGKGQTVEIQASDITVYGSADPATYPLQKKGHSLEFLREIAHLRPRTNTFGAVLRIRHAMAFAVHQFFNDRGFYYVHTPIITGSDAEGAGQMFRVTTLPDQNPPLTEDKSGVDYKQDFFGKQTNLTVSGQLEGEIAAMALGKVYTFGPTFRAENSNTARHLAEFWMIEPEVAFNDLQDNMDLAEDFLRYLVRYALDNCQDDLKFLNEQYDKELLNRLQFVVDNDFQRLNYTEAVEILKSAKQKFEFPVDWGTDLQSEHERYLVEKHFKKPVILTNYPKDIKAFYMKLNDDGKTVRAMDVLFPGIGEIIGGSEREESLEKLTQRMAEMNIPEHELWWYLELRKYGTAPHSGFGLGFERLVLFVTGMANIRDVIPFPRFPKSAEF